MKKIIATAAGVALSLGMVPWVVTPAEASPRVSHAEMVTYKKKHKKAIKKAAWRAYKDYFGETNGCRADFLYAYRGVKVRTSKTPPEWRSAVVNGPLAKRKVGKVYVLKELRPYAGHCD